MLKKVQYSLITLHESMYLLSWKLKCCIMAAITCYLIPAAPQFSTSLFCLQQSHPIKWSTLGHWPFWEPSFPHQCAYHLLAITPQQQDKVHIASTARHLWSWNIFAKRPLPVYQLSQTDYSQRVTLQYLLTHVQCWVPGHSFIIDSLTYFQTNERHWL